MPSSGNSPRDLLLCRAEDEVSIHFFNGGIDQDCASVKMLDGNSTTSARFGAWRWLAAALLLNGIGHATFNVNINGFRHGWKGHMYAFSLGRWESNEAWGEVEREE